MSVNPQPMSQDDVYFITTVTARPAPGTAEEHFGFPGLGGLRKSVNEVRADVSNALDKVAEILSDAKGKVPDGFELNEITVGLGFDAKGQIGFIAEIGVEASIEIKFSRATTEAVHAAP